MMASNKIKTAFFGTPEFAVSVLGEMEKGGLLPDLIITNPDEPRGRKLIITPPPVKVWALAHNIPMVQPEKLSSPDFINFINLETFDLFIVAAYGKIIPESIINRPKHGTINVHPSLLPKYRGPSPVQAAILNGDAETGVSIILLDKEMDHGPILSATRYPLPAAHLTAPELSDELARLGGKLLIETIPKWIAGKIKAEPQNHAKATFTKKIEKKDGFIPSHDLLNEELDTEAAKIIERKIRALNPDPGVFTYFSPKVRGTFVSDRKIRVKITRVSIKNGKLIIEKVIPEGKKGMAWEDFKRGNL